MTRYNVQFKPKRSIHKANASTPATVFATFCGREVPKGALIWDPAERKPKGEETGFYLVPCRACATTPQLTVTYASGRKERYY